ncbi:AraC family transcriptional regulator [Paenibacillus typhae]|uniref:AraC-type DNA-binding protein n=1 Tax=Paenibacillus typhae TaxID=1174501 RepID=A0A1G8QQU6_9BACL|nr:AraC family transcriptional regulator [Paenibacillus typhae]SDJ07077.1 AraC-type DNA-binding protein [Paenibacillus typhae]
MDNPEHYEYRIQINPYLLNADLNIIFAGAARPEPLHKIGPAVHPYILIHTVESGCGTFVWQGKSYRLGQGDTFVIFPGVLFSYEADHTEPWSYRWVAIQGPNALEMLKKTGITTTDPIVRGADPEHLAGLFESIERVLEQQSGETVTTLATDGWFRILLAEFARLNVHKLRYSSAGALTDSERAVEQAIRWFQTQYMLPVSIDKLAASLGYHRTHFTKVFKQLTSQSPKQYINQVRLERAKELLRTNLSVEQVGNSCGFTDPLYFSKQFKLWTGESPSQFREGLRRGADGNAGNKKA